MENIFIGAWKDKRGIAVDDVSIGRKYSIGSNNIKFNHFPWNNFSCIFMAFCRTLMLKTKKAYSDVIKWTLHFKCISLARKETKTYTMRVSINSWITYKPKYSNWSFMSFQKEILLLLRWISLKFCFVTLTWYINCLYVIRLIFILVTSRSIKCCKYCFVIISRIRMSMTCS